jgi:hypothetical protein
VNGFLPIPPLEVGGGKGYPQAVWRALLSPRVLSRTASFLKQMRNVAGVDGERPTTIQDQPKRIATGG